MPEKNKKSPAQAGRPTAVQLAAEIRRRDIAHEFRNAVYSVIRTLLIFAAAAVLVSTLWLPMFAVQQGSMTPTLRDGDLVIFITTGSIERGDVIAFHYNNQVLMKRVIAGSGEWVDIDTNGRVTVNKEALEEPYVLEHNRGVCNIDMPLQVPDRQFFVMGDNRATSLDSRTVEIGTIHKEQITGKALIRIWPLTRFGFIK